MTEHDTQGTPDFESIREERVVLPYGDDPFLRLSYGDPRLEGYEMIVVADSQTGSDDPSSRLPERDEKGRLTTIIARFPRCILSEVNTHRVFGRNSASSRARSVKTTIRDVMTHPYVPLFTKNQKGMSGRFLSGRDVPRAREQWLRARDAAVASELRLLMGDLIPSGADDESIARDYESLLDLYYEKAYLADVPDARAISVHKQDANRIIEPFMWHEAIITSSFWANFLSLRTDIDTAQPAIVALAFLVRRALAVSVPERTWIHLPFVPKSQRPEGLLKFSDVRDAALRSATECARISYRDRSKETKTADTTKLGERLLKDRHMSPFEHIAFDRETYMRNDDPTLPRGEDELRGNIDSSRWIQFRKVLEHVGGNR